MKALILLSILFLNCACLKRNEHHSYSMSTSFSSFSSIDNKHGKPETHIRTMETEEYRDKSGDAPEQIRKYGEMFSKDNDQPGILKKRANTNVEEEGLILGNNPEETKVLQNDEQEKNFLNNFKSDNFFSFQKEKSFFDKFFEGFGTEKHTLPTNHGNYDKFLGEKKNHLISHNHK